MLGVNAYGQVVTFGIGKPCLVIWETFSCSKAGLESLTYVTLIIFLMYIGNNQIRIYYEIQTSR